MRMNTGRKQKALLAFRTIDVYYQFHGGSRTFNDAGANRLFARAEEWGGIDRFYDFPQIFISFLQHRREFATIRIKLCIKRISIKISIRHLEKFHPCLPWTFTDLRPMFILIYNANRGRKYEED